MDQEISTVAKMQFQDRSDWSVKLHRYRWMLLFIVLPVMLATIYYAFIASGQYISESRFVIKSPGQRPSQMSTLANLVQTTSLNAGSEQATEVVEFLRSRDALTAIQRNQAFERRYSAGNIDVGSRFTGDTFEDLFKYYTKAVTADFEKDSGVVVLKVRAFTPKDSRDLNEALLLLSEGMINRLNDRAQTKSISEAERRVRQAELRVRNARIAVRSYRNSQALLDPGKQAMGVLDVANRLTVEYAGLQAQLQQMQRLTPSNPALPTVRARAAAIRNQVAAQSGRVVGNDQGMASKIGQYEGLAAEQEFSQQMLAAAGAALEQARVDSQKQQFYLERVVEPNLPDEPLLPRTLRQILTVAGAAICLYMIGWMLIVGVLEHSSDD
jgi:capsular polysaccharide transport system permease protein